MGERMHKKYSLFTGLFYLLLMACGGGGGGSSSTPPPAPLIADDGDSGSDGSGDAGESVTCDVPLQIDFVEAVTDSWYLWYDEMAGVDKASYESAQAYLDARLAPLIDDGRDRGFSYMTTITEDETSISSGAYVGFGFRSNSTSAGFFIIDVFESGPAWAAGVRRGMELVAVDTGNGFETLAQLSERGATSEEIFGPRDAGIERGFRFRQNGTEVEFFIAKDELSPPALAGKPSLIERSGLAPVGYLHLRQFINAALTPEDGSPSLTDATTLFKEASVTDLIIDLRYNGGGLLSVADTMMDLLAGMTATGEPSFKIQVNDQHPDFNEDQDNWGLFDALPDTFSPIRIAFITSRSTASASELVINGLHPHIDAVMVGGNTYGKQVGQGRWDLHELVEGLEREDCDVALRLTAFEIVNGENEGGYHQVGLDGTGRFTLCAAEDDISHPFGDPKEASVATALDWLGTGSCPSSASGNINGVMANQRVALPAWLEAEYIPERVDDNLR
ncbi:MAG TPA: peptidase S41 [Gammaproteobacteria bacterium]|nr:peptidase S41 [Gammaproteobacteria bacterium]